MFYIDLSDVLISFHAHVHNQCLYTDGGLLVRIASCVRISIWRPKIDNARYMVLEVVSVLLQDSQSLIIKEAYLTTDLLQSLTKVCMVLGLVVRRNLTCR